MPPSSLIKSSAGFTSVGAVRKRNEDAFFADDALGLYIVCDGLGGHAGGDIASQMAIEQICERFLQERALLKNYHGEEEELRVIEQYLISSVHAACGAIFSRAEKEPELSGMATTLTALYIIKDKAIMTHVGDSRLYIERAGTLHQLSRDHTFSADLLRKNLMTAEQAAKSPYSHILTRSVGLYESVEIDSLRFDVLAGDKFILCSDGCHGAFDSSELLQEAIPSISKEGVEAFVKAALANDGSDNITAVLIEAAIQDSAQDEELQRSRHINLKIDTLQQMYLFQTLTLDELLLVVSNIEVVLCSASDSIVYEGDKSDRLFVILEGSVSVTVEGKQIALLRAGNHFGEMGLLRHAPRSATVTALEDSQLLLLKASDFHVIISQENELGVKLLWNLAVELTERLQKTTNSFIVGPKLSESLNLKKSS